MQNITCCSKIRTNHFSIYSGDFSFWLLKLLAHWGTLVVFQLKIMRDVSKPQEVVSHWKKTHHDCKSHAFLYEFLISADDLKK